MYLVHVALITTTTFCLIFSGTVADAGKQWYDCTIQAGFGKKTQLDVVDDGAKYIAIAIKCCCRIARGRHKKDEKEANMLSASGSPWREKISEALGLSRDIVIKIYKTKTYL